MVEGGCARRQISTCSREYCSWPALVVFASVSALFSLRWGESTWTNTGDFNGILNSALEQAVHVYGKAIVVYMGKQARGCLCLVSRGVVMISRPQAYPTKPRWRANARTHIQR